MGKRANYIGIQITHHVPNKNQEVLPIRTGMERTIAQRNTDVFASAAVNDGVVEDINEKAGLIRVRYADRPMLTSGKLDLPYPSSVIDTLRNKSTPLGIVIPGTLINSFQIGQVFSATDKTNVKVLERMRFKSLDEVPDKAAVKAAPKGLAQKLKDGEEDSVYYLRLMPIPVKEEGEVDVVPFGVFHTAVSGSYVKQTVVPNVVKGEKFKKGDILAYNVGFFKPDNYTKQVDWAHGVLANVALIEMSATLEDGCMISRDFSTKMEMEPAHLRTITIENDTVIHSVVSVGDHVETTDFLCTVEAGDLEAAAMSDDPEMVAHLAQLDRKAPRAKYPGVVEDIVVYYSCPREKLHPSILALVKSVEKRYRVKADFAKGTIMDGTIAIPGYVEPGSKYHGVEFTDNTVVLEFMIAENIPTEAGDKLVVCSANKTIVTAVADKPMITQSGKPIDVTFSTVSIMARIVASPYIVGIATPNQKAIRAGAVDMFFN